MNDDASEILDAIHAIHAEIKALREHLGAPAPRPASKTGGVIGTDTYGMPIFAETTTSA